LNLHSTTTAFAFQALITPKKTSLVLVVPSKNVVQYPTTATCSGKRCTTNLFSSKNKENNVFARKMGYVGRKNDGNSSGNTINDANVQVGKPRQPPPQLQQNNDIKSTRALRNNRAKRIDEFERVAETNAKKDAQAAEKRRNAVAQVKGQRQAAQEAAMERFEARKVAKEASFKEKQRLAIEDGEARRIAAVRAKNEAKMANAKRAADQKVAEDARIANKHRIVAEMAEVRKLALTKAAKQAKIFEEQRKSAALVKSQLFEARKAANEANFKEKQRLSIEVAEARRRSIMKANDMLKVADQIRVAKQRAAEVSRVADAQRISAEKVEVRRSASQKAAKQAKNMEELQQSAAQAKAEQTVLEIAAEEARLEAKLNVAEEKMEVEQVAKHALNEARISEDTCKKSVTAENERIEEFKTTYKNNINEVNRLELIRVDADSIVARLTCEGEKVADEKRVLFEVVEKAKLVIGQTSNDAAGTAEMKRYSGVISRAESMLTLKADEERKIVDDKQVAASILKETILQMERAAQETKTSSDVIQAAEQAKEQQIIDWEAAVNVRVTSEKHLSSIKVDAEQLLREISTDAKQIAAKKAVPNPRARKGTRFSSSNYPPTKVKRMATAVTADAKGSYLDQMSSTESPMLVAPKESEPRSVQENGTSSTTTTTIHTKILSNASYSVPYKTNRIVMPKSSTTTSKISYESTQSYRLTKGSSSTSE